MADEQHHRYRLEWVQDISRIPKEAWNALALPLETPVLEWEWLYQMEASESMRPETGWLPIHLTLWGGAELVAAAPLYVKGHSEGEFVWDYIWADVAGRLGIPYYPKMVGMSPATPVSGYRFLMAPGEDEQRLTAVMVEAIDGLCRQNNMAGLSFNFVDPQWLKPMEELGFVAWKHQSYVWENPGFNNFEDYLWSFDKNQRRNIRRERKKLSDQNLVIQPLSGEQITVTLLQRMYRFYELTNAQFGPWGAKYLNREFFTGLHENYRHRILLLGAFERNHEAEPVGMSFLLRKGRQLYGRYWGSSGHYDSLHFNACYYSPIEWAIHNGVRRFDPGIGSAHKVRRGFQATANWSLHRFYDPNLARIMAQHIDEINHMEQERIDALNRIVPFAEDRPPRS
ncbi:MAG: GNAT family N-acetyltransferase [Spirochaetaceae bacterium]|nr:MAG: GNAT family N-acetyltransferase [Spirochaetaceae bacterium]